MPLFLPRPSGPARDLPSEKIEQIFIVIHDSKIENVLPYGCHGLFLPASPVSITGSPTLFALVNSTSLSVAAQDESTVRAPAGFAPSPLPSS